jgi:hypothetical protein
MHKKGGEGRKANWALRRGGGAEQVCSIQSLFESLLLNFMMGLKHDFSSIKGGTKIMQRLTILLSFYPCFQS